MEDERATTDEEKQQQRQEQGQDQRQREDKERNSKRKEGNKEDSSIDGLPSRKQLGSVAGERPRRGSWVWAANEEEEDEEFSLQRSLAKEPSSVATLQCSDPNCSFWQRVAMLSGLPLLPPSIELQGGGSAACCCVATSSPSPPVSSAAAAMPAPAASTTTRLAFARRNSSHLVGGASFLQHQSPLPHLRVAPSSPSSQPARSPSDQSLATGGCRFVPIGGRRKSSATSMATNSSSALYQPTLQSQSDGEEAPTAAVEEHRRQGSDGGAVSVCAISVTGPSGRRAPPTGSGWLARTTGRAADENSVEASPLASGSVSDDEGGAEGEDDGNESDDDATDDERDASSSLRARPASACGSSSAASRPAQSAAPTSPSGVARARVDSSQPAAKVKVVGSLGSLSGARNRQQASRGVGGRVAAASTAPIVVRGDLPALFSGRPTRHQSVNERPQQQQSLYVAPSFLFQHLQSQHQQEAISGDFSPPTAATASQQQTFGQQARRLGSHSPSRFNFGG